VEHSAPSSRSREGMISMQTYRCRLCGHPLASFANAVPGLALPTHTRRLCASCKPPRSSTPTGAQVSASSAPRSQQSRRLTPKKSQPQRAKPRPEIPAQLPASSAGISRCPGRAGRHQVRLGCSDLRSRRAMPSTGETSHGHGTAHLIQHGLLALADLLRPEAHETAVLGCVGGGLRRREQPPPERCRLLRRGTSSDDPLHGA
jgi:hypothetical protein